jgi:hypothetical protein
VQAELGREVVGGLRALGLAQDLEQGLVVGGRGGLLGFLFFFLIFISQC